MIFIAGAEGSGTTLLRRLLAAPERCASLGRDLVKLPNHPDALPLFAALEEASKRLWDRLATLAEHEQARADWHLAADRIRLSPGFAGQTHVVLKRSFPFEVPRGRFVPDLWDVLDLPGDTRIVVIYREPCAAVYSALRRGFDPDLRRLAVRCSEQLTWLAGQVRAIGPGPVRIVSYRALCADPEAVLSSLARFCGMLPDPMLREAASEGLATDTDRRYATELPPTVAAWLEAFFDMRRRRQWDILEQAQ